RSDECETVLRPYRATARPRVVRLTPSAAARPRNPEMRRRYRDDAFARYFAGSRRIALDLRSVVLKRPALFVGEPLSAEKIQDASAVVGDRGIWAQRPPRDTAVL